MTPELQKIFETHKTKSNKELSAIVVNLFKDFGAIKESILILNANLGDIEKVYNAVYAELQSRLKFETPKQ